jgi:ABC-type transport system involved in cytochrome bd biosynthesis fused ATPase/permease subunit
MAIAVVALAVIALAATGLAVTGDAATALATVFLTMAGGDPLDKALRDLEGAVDDNSRRMAQIKRRIAEIRRQRSAGRSYREIVEATKGDLSVQLITEATQSLDEFGARVRRTEALALHNEGMTMEEIARKFGVTRQRVSALLREAGGEASANRNRAHPRTRERPAARRG